MNNEELKAHTGRTAPQIKGAAGLWAVGMMTIMAITITWVAISLAWAGDYYAYSKSVRDAAEAGSSVLATLGNIQTTQAWVLPLQILGLSIFLLGFGFAFSNILQNVRLRGDSMAAVLPAIKARRSPTT